MKINEILKEKGKTQYWLSKNSGVPKTTIIDVCSGKTRIDKCSAGTLYKISKALGITMESLIESEMEGESSMEKRSSFEVFKSNVCHLVKDQGDIDFMINTLENNEIRKMYDRKWYPEALYLLAMVDYLSRENSVPLCTNYDDIRACKLKRPLYPTSLLMYSAAMNKKKEENLKDAIPEFMRFNIIESEIRNVF